MAPKTRLHHPTPTFVMGGNANELRRMGDLFAYVGLEEHAALLRDAVARYSRLVADTERSQAAIKDKHQALTRSLADGTAEPSKAAAELDKVRRSSAEAGTVKDLVHHGKRRIILDALNHLHSIGDNLVIQLDAVVQQSVKELVEASADAGRINDDTDLIRASVSEFSAWQTMTSARERIEAAWRLATTLRSLHLVPALRPNNPPSEDWRWRDLAPVHDGTGRNQHPTRRLLSLVHAGAGPCCITATEMLELIAPSPLHALGGDPLDVA
jgi:hypothetical protein